MTSRLASSTEGMDRISRSVYVTPGGRIILATLDMVATERLARLRVGIDDYGVAPKLRPWWRVVLDRILMRDDTP